MALVGVLFIISGISTHDLVPCIVDLYVSTEEVSLEDITKYFDVSEMNVFDDTLVCRIKVKPECYQEVLESYEKFMEQ